MIDVATGEVSFRDGLCISAHALIGEVAATLPNPDSISSRELSAAGWHQYKLGVHGSEFGSFVVEVSVSAARRVEGVFLSHSDRLRYKQTKNTPSGDDAERRAFHENVIAADLRGQREFSWGEVFCKLDREANRDWLVVIYNPFANVPLSSERAERTLAVHEPLPEKATDFADPT